MIKKNEIVLIISLLCQTFRHDLILVGFRFVCVVVERTVINMAAPAKRRNVEEDPNEVPSSDDDEEIGMDRSVSYKTGGKSRTSVKSYQ